MGTPMPALPPELRDKVQAVLDKHRQASRRPSRRPSRHRVAGRAVHKPGVMNKTEQAYADHLQHLLDAGTITEFSFEPEKLRLAKKTFYTPDFRVQLPNGEIEFHEVKGFWEDDARVKIKVAAENHPYRFVAVQKKAKKDGGGWKYEFFGNTEITVDWNTI